MVKKKNGKSIQKPKSKAGRKPVITADEVRKLETAFNNDYDITEALIYSGVKRTTYYDKLKKDKQFSDDMAVAQSKVSMKCKSVVIEAVMNGSVPDARWWLERRRRKDYATRSELTGSDGEQLEGIIIFKPEKYKDEPRMASAPGPANGSTKTK
jgi:hypothetical protein